MSKQVLVLIEHHEGEVRKASAQALGVGKLLATKMGGTCTAIVVGGGTGAVASKVSALGCGNVEVIDDASFDKYLGEAWSAGLGAALADHGSFVLLMGASALGRDLAPRLAQRLGGGHLGDVTGVEVEGGKLLFTRPIYAGKASEVVELLTERCVVTLRPNAFPMPGADVAETIQMAKLSGSAPSDLKSAVLEIVKRSGLDTVELTEADIIVSGGIGVGGPEGYAPLKELCKVLGAALGASRAAVHAGWIGADHQVGQTGKTVSPSLYIACGISGQIQHQAGMRTSKCIVAINTDPNAPIFQIAHYGIVGDVKEIVPKLTEEFRQVLSR